MAYYEHVADLTSGRVRVEVEANRTTLDAFTRWACEQGLIPRAESAELLH